jgi:hypothetical protein
MPSDDYHFVALLCQSYVERCIVASAFETVYKFDFQSDAKRKIFQLEHYLDLFHIIIGFRQRMGYKPLTFEINYHGDSLVEALNRLQWGYECTNTFNLIIRQNVDTLFVNIYDEYKLVKRLEENDFKYK